MSASSFSVGEPKYYDPAEVEAYVNAATATIKALQARLTDAIQRAEASEAALDNSQPETAGLGRALLLASEVADKTISEAEARAAEVVRAAEERGATLVAAAEAEATRLVDAARETAADIFRKGEARLLGAVNAFVEGSTVLREELAKVGDDATGWRVETPAPPTASVRDSADEVLSENESPFAVSPFLPPRPILGDPDHHRNSERRG